MIIPEVTITTDMTYFSIFLAAVASMAVGFIWYSPIMFGKPWMKLMGLTTQNMQATKKEMGKMYALSFIATLVTAYVLTLMMTLLYESLTTHVVIALWIWLGFVAPVQFTDVIFGGKKWKLFAINTGYQLASLLVMGVVISLI